MHQETCAVVENRPVAPGHFVLKMRSPRIAKHAKPGQFVQVLCSNTDYPLLPRPFSFLTADSKDFSILYHVVGDGTRLLQKAKKGDILRVIGPLGNGFDEQSRTTRLLVGGGVGIPPLFHLTQVLLKNGISKDQIHVFLGARNKLLLLCETDFKKLGVHLHLATDDGSKGTKGFVTRILEDFLMQKKNSVKISTCGPTPMLKAVSNVAERYETPCEVSVEVPMACGFGACLGCAMTVQDAKSESGVRYAVACMEGPVFCGKDIVW